MLFVVYATFLWKKLFWMRNETYKIACVVNQHKNQKVIIEIF